MLLTCRVPAFRFSPPPHNGYKLRCFRIAGSGLPLQSGLETYSGSFVVAESPGARKWTTAHGSSKKRWDSLSADRQAGQTRSDNYFLMICAKMRFSASQGSAVRETSLSMFHGINLVRRSICDACKHYAITSKVSLNTNWCDIASIPL